MISSKILAQSAAAGLMAGAILTSPLFVLGPEESSLQQHDAPQPHTMSHEAQRAFQRAHATQHVLRAAPQARVQASNVAYDRSVADRNQAARQALQQIEIAYEHSDALHRGKHTAQQVTLHSMATQSATRVNLKAMQQVFPEHLRMRLNAEAAKHKMRRARSNANLRAHGPLILPSK